MVLMIWYWLIYKVLLKIICLLIMFDGGSNVRGWRRFAFFASSSSSRSSDLIFYVLFFDLCCVFLFVLLC